MSLPLRSRAGAAVVCAIAGAAALRGLTLFGGHPAPELQEWYPRGAVLAVVGGTWRPPALVHGSALFDALRAIFTLWYAGGLLTGAYHERVDLLAAFVESSSMFVLAGRLVVLFASLVAVWLAARLGTHLGGRAAGPAAAAILAVTFIHVRESLHVWPDAVAASGAIATVVAALASRKRGTLRSAAVLGAVAGLALACKHAVFPLALPVALALWSAPASARASRTSRFVVATAGAVTTYLVLSPYTVIEWNGFLLEMRIQAAGALGTPAAAWRISRPELAAATLGTGSMLLAVVGLIAAARRAPATTAIAALFPLAYLALLLTGTPFARYFAVAAPFVAAFAGAGAAELALRVASRHAVLVTTGLVLLASVAPAAQSWHYVRLLGRTDTRVLAGDWLRAHAAPGTRITLPNILAYPNPDVAPDGFRLRLEYGTWQPALVARGLGDPARTFRLRYQGLLSTFNPAFTPADPYVVTATTPSPLPVLSTPPANEDKLRTRGYEIAVRFDGVPDPSPEGLLYDPQEADYTPLLGADRVARPGPTLTIWRAPTDRTPRDAR